MILKVQLSYADDSTVARLRAYDQWRNNIFSSQLLTELKTPAQFDDLGKFVHPEDLDQSVRISDNPEQHIQWLQQDIELGFDELIIHKVNREQERFIEVCGQQVLPFLTH